jgi:hypothetical protein
MSGAYREGVVGGWRRLHNEELYNLYTSPSIVMVRCMDHVACMVEMRNPHRMVRKLEGKRPLGRPGHRWEDNIRIDLREVGWGVVDWIHLA